MKFHIENGGYIGTAEWQAPGQVALEMDDEGHRAWFARYFSAEDSFMAGPVESAAMAMHRRDDSPRAFEHSAFRLAAYSYKVRRSDDRAAAHG